MARHWLHSTQAPNPAVTPHGQSLSLATRPGLLYQSVTLDSIQGYRVRGYLCTILGSIGGLYAAWMQLEVAPPLPPHPPQLQPLACCQQVWLNALDLHTLE